MIPFKIDHSFCFSLRGNLNFLDFLQKSFITLTTGNTLPRDNCKLVSGLTGLVWPNSWPNVVICIYCNYWIQTSQSGDQPYDDTSPYLLWVFFGFSLVSWSAAVVWSQSNSVKRLALRCIKLLFCFAQVQKKQCDQIGRNFATLYSFFSVYLLSICPNFQRYFNGKSLMLLGKFPLLQMTEYWIKIKPYGHTNYSI